MLGNTTPPAAHVSHDIMGWSGHMCTGSHIHAYDKFVYVYIYLLYLINMVRK